ncbi:MAG TPA: S4 domain-containing protein [Salinisphaeraceae bacterium]|nr:S4 domain-containing protein [Salinisphaeraceae bacterium]
MTDAGPDMQRVRLDKWLWAARFYKTRSQATTAIKGGHVHVNGQRGKPGGAVRIGDQLQISKGPLRFVVDVAALADQRGPAVAAQKLYVETAASRNAREAVAAERRAARQQMPRPATRPDKKQRRALRRFKQRG